MTNHIGSGRSQQMNMAVSDAETPLLVSQSQIPATEQNEMTVVEPSKKMDVENQNPERYPLFSLKSTRFMICLLLTSGVFTTVSMRVNLSMAVVCMVNSTAFIADSSPSVNSVDEGSSTQDTCPRYDNVLEAQKSGYNGDLLWSPSMQSMLFSSTFYGAAATIAFSGIIADKFGPKKLLLAAAIDYVLITLLTPFLAKWSYMAYFVARIIMGIGEGFVFPCISSISGRWFAPDERSTMAALFTSGNQIAASLSSIIAAQLCASALGWESIFYLFGALGVIWCTVWYFVSSNVPSNNRWISKEELEFLERTVPHAKKGNVSSSVPWRSILTSVPLLAAITCQFSFNMQAGIFQAFLPTYLKDSLRLPLQSNGFYTMIPFLTQLVSKNILAILADYLKRNKIVKHTPCAKAFQTISSLGGSITLLALAYIPTCHTSWLAVPILALHGIFLSAGICGFYTSILSIAPAYSGTLGSYTMIFGMLGNLAGPWILSVLTIIAPISKWQFLFTVCSVTHFLSGAFFLLCGSAEVQPWAQHLPQKVSDVVEIQEVNSQKEAK